MNIKRLKLATLGILAVGAITLWPNIAKADQVIYSQPLQTPLVDAGGLYEQFGSFDTADTFTLAQGASIDSLQWWGSYENNSSVGFPTADATDFVFFLGPCLGSDCLTNDDADLLTGFPTEFSPSMANETFLGTSTALNINGDIPSESSNYSYQVNFATPLQLSSGEYFLSIFPELPSTDLGWSFDAGTGGDGISQGLNPTLLDNFDLAFTLNGTPTAPVPEPSSLPLFGIGLGLVFLLARRARRLPSPVSLLVLLVFACLPATAHADTFTLNGASIDSFSTNPTLKTLSVQMSSTDALPYLTDVMLGTEIPALTLDEFAIVDGTQTLENEFEFRGDTVKNYQYVSGSDMLTSDVTFLYGEAKATGAGGSGGTGGGTSPVPEPSCASLLACGMLGLIGFRFRKRAAAPASVLPGAYHL